MGKKINIHNRFRKNARATVYQGDCLELLASIPNDFMQLIVTSPPYNIGKEYEKKVKLEEYISQQARVIGECFRVLSPSGHICWQVGNYVNKGSIVPLDTLLYPIFRSLDLKMRNRIIWHFGHGLHCKKRFSGRYETLMWFTKSDDYFFNLDPVREPQKYPGKKYYKGVKAGQYSCNPNGKNPSDVWSIPNVKANHIEKTVHPCQFPIELIDRLVLSMTKENDSVFDPFLGVGTTIVSAIRHNRKGHGAEIHPEYVEVAKKRITDASNGTLRVREINTPIYDHKKAGKHLTTAPWLKEVSGIK